MVNYGPVAADIGLPVWDIPVNSNGFRVLASLQYRCRSTGVNQTVHDCLAVSSAGTPCIMFLGHLPPNRILQDAKFTLRPSLALSYISSVNVRHWRSGRQPNFVAWYKEWNYGTFAESATYTRQGSHHIWHRPTF